MRWTPGSHPALFRPPEQFFHIPLPAEGIHDTAGAPDMAVGAKHAPSQTGPLQQVPARRINMPFERQTSANLFDFCHNELCQVLTVQCLLHPAF